jgi:hypothetical protein
MKKRGRSPVPQRAARRIEPMILSAYGFCLGECGCGQDFLNAHRSNTIVENRGHIRYRGLVVDSGCGVPRKGLGDLSREPDLRWVPDDIEVNDSSSTLSSSVVVTRLRRWRGQRR